MLKAANRYPTWWFDHVIMPVLDAVFGERWILEWHHGTGGNLAWLTGLLMVFVLFGLHVLALTGAVLGIRWTLSL